MNLIKILFTVLLFIGIRTVAQDNSTINFESGKTWQETKEKANKANKLIFLDAYTTWCIPCKEMEADIFPQKKVASFFNDNFINFKVQIDQTDKDSEQVRKSYADAKFVEQTYDIKAYPTYLFLNADGVVVHFIVGGTTDADEFINKAKAALDPKTQYIKVREQFDAGRRDTAFLKSLIDMAAGANDAVNRPIYVQTFLKTQTNLLTKRNIQFIAQSVRNSTDIGFKELITRKDEIIPVIGSRWRNYIISSVAFDELILPKLRRNGKKEISVSGMIIYQGEIEKEVDWNAIANTLHDKFGSDAERILIDAKTTYYKWNSDWKNLNLSLKGYLSNAKAIDLDFVCNVMQYFVSFCKDAKELANADKWMILAASQQGFTCSKTYGIYLYNTGKFKEANRVLLAYQESLKQPDKEVAALIEKTKDQ